MRIKTFQTYDLQEMEDKLNAFDEKADVRATQTHVTYLPESGKTKYTAITWYIRVK